MPQELLPSRQGPIGRNWTVRFRSVKIPGVCCIQVNLDSSLKDAKYLRTITLKFEPRILKTLKPKLVLQSWYRFPKN